MLQMKLDLKGLSYNNYRRFNKNGSTYVTAKGKKYLEELTVELNKFDSQLRYFGSRITKDIELVDMEIYYFQKNFYTKQGTVSKTAGDVDNPNKVLIDEIFKRIGWDDYILGRLSCEKLSGQEDCIIVRMSTYDVDKSIESLAEVLDEYLDHLSSQLPIRS